MTAHSKDPHRVVVMTWRMGAAHTALLLHAQGKGLVVSGPERRPIVVLARRPATMSSVG